MTTLTLTPTLGRQSTRYPDGRPYKASWNSVRIVYPRPTSERNAGGASDGGLNGEYDKWLAGTPWFPCLGVQWGAFPYRVVISNEMVDSVPASTGVQFAEYIEDHVAGTKPYLGFYHPGFTAPAGGTKLIEFTITVTDCLGTTDTYPVALTVYAQDHASVLSHFRVVDTTAGTNGTGHWSSPINTISGADVNSNKTLYGTSWSSTTHCPKTVIVLLKDGSTLQPTGMTNMPGTLSATTNVLQEDYFPRTFIGVYGATVTIDFAANAHGFNSQGIGTDLNDVLIKNIKFANNTAASTSAVNFGEGYRCHIHDCLLDTFGASDPGNNNLAPFRTSGLGFMYDCTLLRNTITRPYALSSATGNYWYVSLISWHRGLLDDLTFNNLDHALTYKPNGFVRCKHDTEDTEFRRINAVVNATVALGDMVRFSTGGGIGASANKHIRVLIRHCNLYSTGVNSITIDNGGASTQEQHSVQVHFCSLKGRTVVNIDTGDDIENARQFLYYRNVAENADATFATTNTTTVAGESAVIVDNILGTSGVLTTAGLPVTSAYTGQYGHTVITV